MTTAVGVGSVVVEAVPRPADTAVGRAERTLGVVVVAARVGALMGLAPDVMTGRWKVGGLSA